MKTNNIKIENVTAHIGKRYKEWVPGEMIIIPSYVGSGKTHFVFNELLESLEEGQKIVYLCNRKTLKEQVLRKSKEKAEEEAEENSKSEQDSNKEKSRPAKEIDDPKKDVRVYKENLYVFSYQYCEVTGQFPNFKIRKKDLFPEKSKRYSDNDYLHIDRSEVRYYIFDEAHYFATDVAFNTKCHFWSSKDVCSISQNSTSVFLTATPEPLYCFLELCKYSTFESEYAQIIKDRKKITEKLSKKLSDYKTGRKKYQSEIHCSPQDETIFLDESATCVINTKRQVENFGDVLWEIAEHNTEIFNELTSDEQWISKGEIDEAEYWDRGVDFFAKKVDKFRAFSVVVEFVASLLERYKATYSKYAIERDYNNYECKYFQDYDDLSHEILNSSDQWLVFVDSEADGKYLEGAINVLHKYLCETPNSKFVCNFTQPYAVFLSRNTIQKKRSSAYYEHQNIIKHESFCCKVLIATKLLDCGVNIGSDIHHCPVNNIAISQTDKTEFIQMLGRVRTIDHKQTDDEKKVKKAKLYIKSTDQRTIKNSSGRMLGILSRAFYFLEQKSKITLENPHGGYFKSLARDIKENNLSPILRIEMDEDKDGQPFDISKILRIDRCYLAYCLYQIYQYYGFLLKKPHKNQDNDDSKEMFCTRYLSEQLDWLSLEYHADNWIMVEKYKKEIMEKMAPYVGQKRCYDNEKLLEFKIFLLERFLRFPHFLLTDSFVKRKKDITDALREYKSSLLSGEAPKNLGRIINAKTLNKLLKLSKIPYRLNTRRAGSKTSWWIENSIDEE